MGAVGSTFHFGGGLFIGLLYLVFGPGALLISYSACGLQCLYRACLWSSACQSVHVAQGISVPAMECRRQSPAVSALCS